MALKLKDSQNTLSENRVVYEYQNFSGEIPFAPNTLPSTVNVPRLVGMKPIHVPAAPKIVMPEENLPRSINYAADFGGCGFWRIDAPTELLNRHQRACISTLTQMVLDRNFYGPLKSVRLQRQATSQQKDFLKHLREISKLNGMRLIYEIDDVVFSEDIPDYNRCKEGFTDPAVRECILDIMKDMDEITVTCPYMKEYYREKTGNKNITVLPNYAPKSWLGRFYNKEEMVRKLEQQKKRPRILYSGSGTHVDLAYKTGGNDDFTHCISEIIKARKRFKFVWKGCYPLAVKPFIDSGEMEFIEWSILPNYGQGLLDANCVASMTMLTDNNFNRCKSDIKMIESGAIGMPGAYQDMVTYDHAPIKFKTGAELIDQLDYIVADVDRYAQLSQRAYDFTASKFLDLPENLDQFYAIYFSAYGSEERNKLSPKLIELNPEQKFKS
jgi:hypothetical protein